MALFELRTDGGARGNPGPAALGFVLSDPDGRVVAEEGRYLGKTTNNVAEYQAVIAGLEAAQQAGARGVRLLSDSELVVRQLAGVYRVKDAKLQPLHARATELLDGFEDTEVTHVRREENAAADALVNQALDARSSLSGAPTASAAASAAEGSAAATPAKKPAPAGEWELTVKGHFDAAHELVGYPGQCRDLHGHTWDVEVTVVGRTLDDIGIVYDFTRLKADLAAVLDDYDHGHLNEVAPFDEINPTAENLARVICERLQDTVGAAVDVLEVAVWESPVARIVYRPA